MDLDEEDAALDPALKIWLGATIILESNDLANISPVGAQLHRPFLIFNLSDSLKARTLARAALLKLMAGEDASSELLAFRLHGCDLFERGLAEGKAIAEGQAP